PSLRSLYVLSLHDALPIFAHQGAFLDHLVEVVRSERVDAVFVSGDVYDRAIPPVDVVELLTDALLRLTEHTRVVITPGNHDSATDRKSTRLNSSHVKISYA